MILIYGMENFKEKTCLCALNRIFGFEPKIGLELIAQLGSAAALFELSDKELNLLLGPYSKYRGRINRSAIEAEECELEHLKSSGISFCGWTEDCYPELLKECEDPPMGLYVRSSTPISELWAPRTRIAVVGTRDISPYGKDWCEKVVRSLAQTDSGPVIVSGLALGTDITAHRTALDEGIPTIGVMATGPEEVYPFRHREFAQRLVNTPGCALISDYPPGTSPVALNFLRRNRIIAGLSDATLLIESKIKGGGMMTARLAYSYNREVYALPGRVDDLRSQGCNDLIRRKIAEPITSGKHLLDSLGLNARRKSPASSLTSRIMSMYGDALSSEQIDIMTGIIRVIMNRRGITVDELPGATGIDYRTVAELTGILEIDGFICIDLLKRCRIV